MIAEWRGNGVRVKTTTECRAAVRRAVFALFLAMLLLLPVFGVRAQVAAPHAIGIPPWFTESLLDFRDEIRDAARSGKRVMVYFGQDGCPYCKQLMQTNFSQRTIVEKTRRHFVAIALNIWGDREATWIGGRTTSEKQLASLLHVQFTPTLLFLDEQGQIVARLNGYYPPHRFEAVLDYVAGHMETKIALADYMRTAAREAASDRLHDEPFFMKPPYNLRRAPGGRPLIALFETPFCSSCDELHQEGFRRSDVRELVARFDVVRLALGERAELASPQGCRMSAADWARMLNIAYTPTMVFFNDQGREIFRVEAYVRPFHLASALDYVASGAYRREPSFQRFVQARAARMRERGQAVELWK